MFKGKRSLSPFVLIAALTALSASCTKSHHNGGKNAPNEVGLLLPNTPLPLPTPGKATIDWGNGIVSRTVEYHGQTYVKVQGLVAPDTYALRLKSGNPHTDTDVRKDIEDDLRRSLSQLQTFAGQRFLAPRVIGETGYYSTWIPYSSELWTRLHAVKDLAIPITLEVIKFDPKALDRIKEQSDRLGAALKKQGTTTDGFSGLRSIGVTNEFLSQVENEIGSRPGGQNVKIGIVDSGLTYSHPTFLGNDGKTRIRFMKDATPQGKVYFPATSSLKVRLPTQAEIDSSAIPKENLVVVDEGTVHFAPESQLPAGDGSFLQTLPKNLLLNVPPEVKAAIEAGDAIQLGLLAENSFTDTSYGKVYDLNANKNPDDVYGILLTAPKAAAKPDGSVDLSAYKAFVSMEAVGQYDGAKFSLNPVFSFAKAKGLHDFNKSGEVQQSFAEKFGVTINSRELVSEASEKMISSMEVALVGYTPGGTSTHGSHVTGIAAGHATLSNDSAQSLSHGVAPEANIYFYRVCANSIGCGYYEEAIQELALEQKVDVINMSLGGSDEENNGYDTSSLLIDRITQLTGTTFVISAGNEGPGLQTHGSPGNARFAISVAASASRSMMEVQNQVTVPSANNGDTDDDFVMPFSSRGPLSNASFKPNITAPGTELSSIAFNVIAGRSGSEIMQGTSMAAPTATGAFALLLDMARTYNAKHPEKRLPTDYQSLRSVFLGSARPFDVTTLDLETKLAKKGHYTWIDQGVGMVNIPGAWEALKALGQSQLPTGVVINGQRLEPTYQVRTIVTSRYGTLYNGAAPATDAGKSGVTPQGQWGGGLWIDNASSRTLHTIGIARRIPDGSALLNNENEIGSAFNALASSAEFFTLKTEIHGSDIPWLKVNTFFTLNTGAGNTCDSVGAREKLILNGQGALDASGGSGVNGTAESTLFVCVDRSKVATLPPGDHGALIKAYRTNADGTLIENVPAFIIPVYLNIPHETLTGNKPYTVTEGHVKAFETARNYVNVPAGLSSLKVTLSVPKASKDVFGQPQNCSGVNMDVYSASATKRLPDFDPMQVYVGASTCNGPGGAVLDTDSNSFVKEVANPKPGLWEFHVTGFDYYANSTYKLQVDYVKSSSKLTQVVTTKEALKNGSFNIEINESTLTNLAVDTTRSQIILNKAFRKSSEKIITGEDLTIVNGADGKPLRTYPASVSAITLTTDNAPAGSNVEMGLEECDPKGANCHFVAVSVGPTSKETVTAPISPDKAYQVIVIDAKATEASPVSVDVTELLTLKSAATGAVTARTLGTDHFLEVSYALDASLPVNAEYFNSSFFAGKTYDAFGLITVATSEITLSSVPVRVTF
ncbi:MAG: S8 family serine peptidase [Chitinophagaceae bacterium]|nr:S8 family serine peptidase [Oligoflexus sp.]